MTTQFDMMAASLSERQTSPNPAKPNQQIKTAIALTAHLVSPQQLLDGFFSLYPNNISPTVAMSPKPADKLKTVFGEQLKEIPANVIALVVPKIGTAAGRKDLVETYGADLLKAYPPAEIVAALQGSNEDGKPRYDHYKRRKFLEVAVRYNSGELVAAILKSGAVEATAAAGVTSEDSHTRYSSEYNLHGLVWHAMRTNSDRSLRALADHYGIDTLAALGKNEYDGSRGDPAYRKGITDVGILTYKKDKDGDSVGNPIGNISFNQQQIHTALARATGRSMLSLSSPGSQNELELVLQRAQNAGVLHPDMVKRMENVKLALSPEPEGGAQIPLLQDGKYPVAIDQKIDPAELAAAAAIINRPLKSLEGMDAADIAKSVTAALYAAAEKPGAKR